MAETNICESGTPSGFVALSTLVNAGVLSSRPAAGQAGRLYFVTDAGVQRWTRDDGAAWQDVLDHWDQVTGKPATFAPVSHGTSAHTGAVLPGTADEDLGARFLNVKGSAAPANPGAGDRRLYVDSGTGKISVKTSGGQSVSLEEQGGAGGFNMTEVEKNLGATPRRAGKFQITGAGLTAGKPVLVQQAHGPYTGKGTRADEAEMDQVNATGKVLNGTTIDVYWNARTKVRGNMKFNYVVSG